MAADVAKFSVAMDKAWKTFASQEVVVDSKELKGLGDRQVVQHIEQKFQQQLKSARGAFLQEFRNHSVVVESEVKRIREELTAKLEEKYGDKIAAMKRQMDSYIASLAKNKEEIQQLQSLAAAQEAYLSAVRHKWGFEQKERLKAEIDSLRTELEKVSRENEDLTYQLMCRDELVTQLRGELSTLEGELKRQASSFTDEKRIYDERQRSLRLEMRQQQDVFKDHLKQYEERFSEYQQKTAAQIQILDTLNRRQCAALKSMEEERERHIQARTKPSPRIGEETEEDVNAIDDIPEATLGPYDLAKDSRYRVDDMGMDTSWRDYQLGVDKQPTRAGKPKFRGRRVRTPVTARQSGNPVAPQATSHPGNNRTPRVGQVIINGP
mmetsp:Transcript_6241/g.14931  ORF Transcript_6241/g.14931 Transcript_6241/m.14931 type:complete len:380 (+) Transcript_6241:48-1187(+)